MSFHWQIPAKDWSGGSGYKVRPSGGSYRANVDLLDPTALIVSDWPTKRMPDVQSYVSADGVRPRVWRSGKWVVPNSAQQVFPDMASAPIETGVNLTGLLS